MPDTDEDILRQLMVRSTDDLFAPPAAATAAIKRQRSRAFKQPSGCYTRDCIWWSIPKARAPVMGVCSHSRRGHFIWPWMLARQLCL